MRPTPAVNGQQQIVRLGHFSDVTGCWRRLLHATRSPPPSRSLPIPLRPGPARRRAGSSPCAFQIQQPCAVHQDGSLAPPPQAHGLQRVTVVTPTRGSVALGG